MPNLVFAHPDLDRTFDEVTLERGERYWRAGRVGPIQHHPEDDRYVASVQGSRSDPYTVELTLAAAANAVTLSGLCSCPMSLDCKHAAALALELLRGWHAAPETQRAVQPVVAAHPRGALADVASLLPYELTGWLARLVQVGAGTSPEPEHYGAGVKHRLLYILRVADGHSGRQLTVQLAQARERRTGGYSAPKPWHNARQALVTPPSFILRADQRILRGLLLEASTAYGMDYQLVGDSAAVILREMLATGRCHWENLSAPALQEGAPRPGQVRWRFERTGTQCLNIETEPQCDAVLPATPPWYVDLSTHACGPVELPLEPRMAEVVASAPAVAPEHAEHLREHLAQHAAFADLPPPAVPETIMVSGTAPAACLRLLTLQAWSLYRYRQRPFGDYLDVAALAFAYAGVPVARDEADGTVTAFENGKLLRIRRNRRAEKQLRDTLTSFGFAKVMQLADSYPREHRHDYSLLDETRWVDFVGAEVPRLRALGWRVEFDDSFRFTPVEAGAWYADVEEHGNDWFELDLGIEVDGVRRNLLPILLAAMRARPGLLVDTHAGNGDASTIPVVLEDGRLLPVPLERVRPLLAILHELLDANPAGKLRLPRFDAARLAELESTSTLTWHGAEGLRRFGARLAEANRIAPVAPPRGLNAELRPYQSQGLAWLQFLREYTLSGILADDMGLGKTVQALAHILIEHEAGRLDQPVLVVAPTSVVPNWRSEAARFAPQLRVHVSHGLKRKESFAQLANYDIVLTTYPLLVRDREALLDREFHLVILDEAQQVKNAQTQAARVVAALRARHRLCMTGTPLENNLAELWSLFHFLMPGFLGDAASFRRLYRTPIEKHGNLARRTSLARRIRPFLLRRTKETVAAELPPKTEIVQAVELSGAQRDLYETVRASMDRRVRAEIAARGLQQSRIIVLDALLKLRQVCCDPRLVKLEAARKVQDSAKLEALLDLLQPLLAEGRRVLLFSQFTSMLALIETELVRLGLRYSKLTGETRDRKRPVDAFQAGETPLFLISLKAGGTGLNLTAADTVIHYDPWWNPAAENQATDRAHRIGQDKPVFVYKLIAAGSVEEKIVALQASKAALAAAILGESTAGSAQLTAEDIAALFEPLPEQLDEERAKARGPRR